MSGTLFRAAILFAALAALVSAHVGSPDIYLTSNAGPYQLFISIRTPAVIPGVAELEVRSATPGIRELRAVPLPMSGPGAKFAPVPDELKRSQQDPQFFTGSLWLMAVGSWQVRISADGARGSGVIAVPVPSAARMVKKMDAPLGAFLTLLTTFLIFGTVAMVSASVREAELPPGIVPAAAQRSRGRRAGAVTFVLIFAVLFFGARWWRSENASYSQQVFKPLNMRAALQGSTLELQLSDPGWLDFKQRGYAALPVMRTIDDLVPDHGHLMHLYVIRQPGLDVVFHLHPQLAAPGLFRFALPTMPAGTYRLYADIVHQNGFPETLVSTVAIPALETHSVTGDDAAGTTAAWNQSSPGASTFPLPDGYRMQWITGANPLRAKQMELFRFRLLNAQGGAPKDMALYMGMLGHAAFVKPDGSVFAHIHPAGTVAMAAFMKAQQQLDPGSMAAMDMSGGGVLPNEVTFPYGFPSPGRYRIFVQMKHGSTVETGVFDAVAN